ncbi:MAG: ATP-binding cassette domain-containing protein [Acidimicrobiia bacterium]
MADRTIAIDVKGLTKSYGDVHALRGIDLEVPAGTVLGLLGPNGAGKTTVVRILTTLMPPDGGTAHVAGFDVVEEADELRSQIGLAGQYAAVDENLTGRENLEMVGRLYHMSPDLARRWAQQLLERFELEEPSGRLVRTYSGGMRRRLDLAAALVAQPPVLFLDEPTSGLDPRSRRGLLETIQDRVAEGTTVLLTTQYLDEADLLADRVAVIDHGDVIAVGTPDELKARVGGERLEVKLEDPASSEAALRALEPMADGSPRYEDGVINVPLREARGTIAEAVHRLHEVGVAVDDIGLRRPTLDDVFMALTGHVAEDAATAENEDEEAGTGVAAADGRPVGPSLAKNADDDLAAAASEARPRSSVRDAVSDTLVLTRRSLLRIPRAPELLMSYTVQPIMFVLLFVYVFGGAIETGIDYEDFLMPGIIVQTMSFGGFVTALGLSEDLRKGLMDRFRSLPMSRAALLTARTLADVVTNSFSIVVMLTVGLLVGFRFSSSPLEVVGGFLLLLLFGYAFSWVFAYFGLVASTPETAQMLGFMSILPLSFASSAFVPVGSMPGWLQAFAKVNPITIVTDATRALFIGTPAGESIYGAVAWCLGLTAFFGFIAVAQFRKSVSH